ncbi:N-acetylglucosaminyl-phosphatidylinositol de-N-acetylase [Lamellibrachia satsuma]|nr:N-acetylglucosaminyl-phosphatidylinositol de-N-acetylase [Lamellibrachia satsuma]
MFFAPTILRLRKKGIEVSLLCMTTGGYYGNGEERKKELIAAAGLLGVSASYVSTLNHSAIQDGPDNIWEPDLLATVIDSYVTNLHINILITFDEYGVSGHVNHVALYHGVRHYLKMHVVPTDLRVYKLISTSMLRKYSSILDVPFSYITSSIRFVSGWSQIWTAQRAMFAHWSQFVWFRILYIIFSRYMIINTLERFDQEYLTSS